MHKILNMLNILLLNILDAFNLLEELICLWNETTKNKIFLCIKYGFVGFIRQCLYLKIVSSTWSTFTATDTSGTNIAW